MTRHTCRPSQAQEGNQTQPLSCRPPVRRWTGNSHARRRSCECCHERKGAGCERRHQRTFWLSQGHQSSGTQLVPVSHTTGVNSLMQFLVQASIIIIVDTTSPQHCTVYRYSLLRSRPCSQRWVARSASGGACEESARRPRPVWRANSHKQRATYRYEAQDRPSLLALSTMKDGVKFAMH